MKKKNKSIHNQKLTDHHVVAKSIWWVNAQENIKRIWQLVHRSIHNIFENKSPIWQAKELILHINVQVFREEFINDISEILNRSDKDYYYKDWIFRPNYKKHE